MLSPGALAAASAQHRRRRRDFPAQAYGGGMPLEAVLYNLPMSLSGNELTDATRALNVQGDGLTAPAGFGIWEATTNLVENSSFETNTTGWSSADANAVTRDATVSKFGAASLKHITPGLAGGEGVQFQSTASYTGNASTAYTASVWVNAPVGATLRLQSNINGVGPAGTTNFVGTGAWQRVTTTFTPGAGGPAQLLLTITTITSVQAITFRVDGAQIEQNTYATPYVFTDGAIASRSASRTAIPSLLLTAAQGWFAAYVSFGVPSSATNLGFVLFSWVANGVNLMDLKVPASSTNWKFTIASAASTNVTVSQGAFSAGTTAFVVVKWAPGVIGVSANGGAFSTAAYTAPAGMPATFAIGYEQGDSGQFDGNVLWAACGTGTLSDADAAALNASGGTPPSPASLLGSQWLTGMWKAVDGTMQAVSLPTLPMTSRSLGPRPPQAFLPLPTLDMTTPRTVARVERRWRLDEEDRRFPPQGWSGGTTQVS